MSTFTLLNPVDNKDTTIEVSSDPSMIYCTLVSTTTTRVSRNNLTRTKFTQLWVCDRCGALGVDNHTPREKCEHEAISLRYAEIF